MSSGNFYLLTKYYQKIAGLLTTAAPAEGWERLALDVEISLVEGKESVNSTLSYVYNEHTNQTTLPDELPGILSDLRTEMKSIKGGTWYSMEYRLTAIGDLDVQYSYDEP